jgi:hypothetical protein
MVVVVAAVVRDTQLYAGLGGKRNISSSAYFQEVPVSSSG